MAARVPGGARGCPAVPEPRCSRGLPGVAGSCLLPTALPVPAGCQHSCHVPGRVPQPPAVADALSRASPGLLLALTQGVQGLCPWGWEAVSARVTPSSALALLSPALCRLLMRSPSAGAASLCRLAPDAAWKLFGLARNHHLALWIEGGDVAMAPLTPSCPAAGCLPAWLAPGSPRDHVRSTGGCIVCTSQRRQAARDVKLQVKPHML